MRCKKIQELLSADYLDNEISQRSRRDIEGHLAGCPDCRTLAERLQAQRRLLQKSKSEPAPEHLWQNIRDAIIVQRLEQERSERGILGWLKDLFWHRHPVFALASAMTIILFVLVFAGVFIQKKQPANINGTEIYGVGENNGSVIYSLGTAIEDYFL